MGHTMSIHSQNDAIILEFGLKKPAYRIVVNSPTTHGSIGLTTGLDPAMTLGCGGYGGNITSDNISPRHLLNIKRLAYEITPAQNRFERVAAAPTQRATAQGITAEALNQRIDAFLGSRGYKPERRQGSERPSPARAESAGGSSAHGAGVPLDFVCEEDVRLALRAGRKLVVSERAIITPAARELGEEHRVFTPSWQKT
jgi:acetaldehyde dehydrogenase (acetylating)